MSEAEAWFERLVERLRVWRGRRLDGEEEAAVAASLAELGLSEADLATARAGSEADIRRMMARFGIDPERVPAGFLGALRDAERVCAHCLEVGRCHRHLERPAGRDAARLFCPNAGLFDQIAAALRREAGDPDPEPG